VVDASAVLAWLFKERGENAVDKVLPFAVLSAVNLAEVLYRARKQGVRIVEVPVVWRNSSPTKVSAVRSSLDMLKHVIRLRFRV